jgi:hypothetical protein
MLKMSQERVAIHATGCNHLADDALFRDSLLISRSSDPWCTKLSLLELPPDIHPFSNI